MSAVSLTILNYKLTSVLVNLTSLDNINK